LRTVIDFASRRAAWNALAPLYAISSQRSASGGFPRRDRILAVTPEQLEVRLAPELVLRGSLVGAATCLVGLRDQTLGLQTQQVDLHVP
jgi:hypothetical protein